MHPNFMHTELIFEDKKKQQQKNTSVLFRGPN